MATSETLRTYKTCKIYTQTPKDIAQRNLQSPLNERQSYCVHRWETLVSLHVTSSTPIKIPADFWLW